jgi:hypothetical protein
MFAHGTRRGRAIPVLFMPHPAVLLLHDGAQFLHLLREGANFIVHRIQGRAFAGRGAARRRKWPMGRGPVSMFAR